MYDVRLQVFLPKYNKLNKTLCAIIKTLSHKAKNKNFTKHFLVCQKYLSYCRKNHLLYTSCNINDCSCILNKKKRKICKTKIVNLLKVQYPVAFGQIFFTPFLINLALFPVGCISEIFSIFQIFLLALVGLIFRDFLSL